MRRLQCFLAVAEELNFRRAAKQIPMAQAALSVQIKKLEEEIGVTLFLRDTHSVQLTEAGRVYQKAALRVLGILDRGRENALQIHHGEKGSIRVGFVASLYQTTVSRLLQKFQIRYPDIEIEYHEARPAKQITDLKRGRLDVALLGQPEPDKDIVIQPVHSFRLALAAGEGHRLAGRKSVKLADLTGETLLFPEESGSAISNEWLEQLVLSSGAEPVIKRRRGRALTILQQVCLGRGLAIFPEPVFATAVPRLAVIPFAKNTEQFSSSIGYRKNEQEPAVLRFIKHVERTKLEK